MLLLYLFKWLIIFKINFNEKIFHNYAFITIISSSVHCIELSFYLIAFSLSLKNFLQYLFLCWSAGNDSLSFHFSKFFLFKLFIYLLAASGLCCCADFPPITASEGYSPVAVHGLLIHVVSLVEEHGLQAQGLQLIVVLGSRSY